MNIQMVRKRFEQHDKLHNDSLTKFKAKPTDILITTPPKCGTTWLQMIVHQLRSKGDITFEDINKTVVFIEMLQFLDIDATKDQSYQPNAYKCHATYEEVPKNGGKYIIMFRNPLDSFVSLFEFLNNWQFENIDINDFVKELCFSGFDGKEGNKIFASKVYDMMSSWYPHRKDDNVLWLHYEDLKKNPDEGIRLIAEFLDIGKDDKELLELVKNNSSIEFMKKHPSKFDPKASVKPPQHLLPPEAMDKFKGPDFEPKFDPEKMKNGNLLINKGEIGRGTKMLTDDVVKQADEIWKNHIEAISGCKDYESLRASINKELNYNF